VISGGANYGWHLQTWKKNKCGESVKESLAEEKRKKEEEAKKQEAKQKKWKEAAAKKKSIKEENRKKEIDEDVPPTD
jgi:hypothetical protein